MKQPVRKPLSFDELEALEDATGQRHELCQCGHYQGLNGEIRLAALDLRLPLREAYADVLTWTIPRGVRLVI